ncbi:SDR family oxidoreductase [Microlunatus spumicola]|uniref:SDR family oxidoreductase n=1 Tax=Microlunatus spumicola TaxID=81499 RepID=A0ABP6Y6A6_9ACTN
MKIRLKPLDEQVVVVLGASSGIGRASALRLAARGARLVVGARSQPGLASLVQEITAAGGEAVHLVCDAADPDQVQRLADLAVSRFGRIDTWVNAAALSLFATFEDTTPAEFRRVVEVNYLGQVHGALAALPHLRAAGQGALISISSVESRVALPLHAAYSAGKHAVQGAMDALRRDLIADGAPISVTTVKPATIDTPLFTNSRNKMDRRPKGPPPVYSPEVVAACVEHAAEHPVRDLLAGGAAAQMLATEALAPKVMDLLLAKVAIRAESTREKVPGGSPGNLDAPTSDDRVKADLHGRPSLFTWLQLHPRARVLTAAGALAAPTLVRRFRRA